MERSFPIVYVCFKSFTATAVEALTRALWIFVSLLSFFLIYLSHSAQTSSLHLGTLTDSQLFGVMYESCFMTVSYEIGFEKHLLTMLASLLFSNAGPSLLFGPMADSMEDKKLSSSDESSSSSCSSIVEPAVSPPPLLLQQIDC